MRLLSHGDRMPVVVFGMCHAPVKLAHMPGVG